MSITKPSAWLIVGLAFFGVPEWGFSQGDPIRTSDAADKVRNSPIDGIVETTLGRNVYYVSADGNYVFVGELFDVRQQRSLTEAGRELARSQLLNDVDPNDLIVFSPEGGKPQHTLFAVVSLDCSFCQRFHSELGQLLSRQFEIRYLIHAQADDVHSWTAARAVMCSADRKAALSLAFSGEVTRLVQEVDGSNRQCNEAPLRLHQHLVREIGGIAVTPTTVSSSGRLILGHVGYQWLLDNASKPATVDLTHLRLDQLSLALSEHARATKEENSTRSDVATVN